MKVPFTGFEVLFDFPSSHHCPIKTKLKFSSFLNFYLGPRGPKGELGPQGTKGEAGSFDFFMLMMADLRHDLEQLQSRVYPGRERSLPRYNMQQHMAWEQKMKEKHANSALHTND